MRRLRDGVLMLIVQIAFCVYFAGACLLLNDNTKGWIFEAVALVITIPVVILLNRKERA